jgi:hypothetical protein
MTDMMIQDDVLKELRFEPKVNAHILEWPSTAAP